MTLLHKNILLVPCASDEETTGGLFVPESYRTVSNKCIVKAVGHKVTKVKAGDTVFRVKGWGEEMELNGEKCYFMKDDGVIAKLN